MIEEGLVNGFPSCAGTVGPPNGSLGGCWRWVVPQRGRDGGERFERQASDVCAAGIDVEIEVLRDLVESGQQREGYPGVEVLLRAGYSRQAGEDIWSDAVRRGPWVILHRLERCPHGVRVVFITEQARAHAADFLGGLQQAGPFPQRLSLAFAAAQVFLEQGGVGGHRDIAAARSATQRARRSGSGNGSHGERRGGQRDGEYLAAQG